MKNKWNKVDSKIDGVESLEVTDKCLLYTKNLMPIALISVATVCATLCSISMQSEPKALVTPANRYENGSFSYSDELEQDKVRVYLKTEVDNKKFEKEIIFADVDSDFSVDKDKEHYYILLGVADASPTLAVWERQIIDSFTATGSIVHEWTGTGEYVVSTEDLSGENDKSRYVIVATYSNEYKKENGFRR